jgi:hypothetical protein
MESATSALKCSDILGEDTLVNILGLLPAKSLASAACVCRSWNSAARVLNATPRMMSALSLLPDLQVLSFEFLFFFLNPPSPTLCSGQQFQFPLLQDSEHLQWRSVCGPALEIWMRCSSQIQWIHWKAGVTLEKCTSFRAME